MNQVTKVFQKNNASQETASSAESSTIIGKVMATVVRFFQTIASRLIQCLSQRKDADSHCSTHYKAIAIAKPVRRASYDDQQKAVFKQLSCEIRELMGDDSEWYFMRAVEEAAPRLSRSEMQLVAKNIGLLIGLKVNKDHPFFNTIEPIDNEGSDEGATAASCVAFFEIAAALTKRHLCYPARQVQGIMDCIDPAQKESIFKNAMRLYSPKSKVVPSLNLPIISKIGDLFQIVNELRCLPHKERDSITDLSLLFITHKMDAICKTVLIQAISNVPARNRVEVTNCVLEIISPYRKHLDLTLHTRALYINELFWQLNRVPLDGNAPWWKGSARKLRESRAIYVENQKKLDKGGFTAYIDERIRLDRPLGFI